MVKTFLGGGFELRQEHLLPLLVYTGIQGADAKSTPSNSSHLLLGI